MDLITKICKHLKNIRFFRNILSLILLWIVIEVGAQASAVKPVRTSPSNWTIAFELAFGTDSPYSKKFPDLYGLPYAANRNISKDVLGHIIAVAIEESGAQQLDLLYGPGGYQRFPVVPSAQLRVCASSRRVATMMDVIGFLAQQTQVLAARPDGRRQVNALQITQVRGRPLATPALASRFWLALNRRAPQLSGFSPVLIRKKFGLRIINTAKAWSSSEIRGFKFATFKAAKECGVVVRSRESSVELMSRGNNWQENIHGENYLKDLGLHGQKAMEARLLKKYQPQVSHWIRQAFEKYAPDTLLPEPQASQRNPVKISVFS